MLGKLFKRTYQVFITSVALLLLIACAPAATLAADAASKAENAETASKAENAEAASKAENADAASKAESAETASKIALADPSSQRTVRIGWYSSPGFQEGMSDDEEKSGYCYNYLQNISNYNGWKYEYVYGEWSELHEMLLNGEIDALAGVSLAEEIIDEVLVPGYSMGYEEYYLYQHSDTQVMDPEDVSSFIGKRIGVIRNDRITRLLKQWAKDNNIIFDTIYYDNISDRDRDYNNYQLAGILATNNNVSVYQDFAPVLKLGEEPYYLVVNKEREDLLEDLNYALGVMEEMDPYYVMKLQYESYGSLTARSRLTATEKSWISKNNEIRMGYLDDYLPYCKKDEEGNVTGLITDVMDAMISKLGVKDELAVNYVAYHNYKDMVEAVRSGEIDAAFPVGGGLWHIEQDGLDATASVVAASMDLVFKGDFSEEKYTSIAVNKNNNMQYYFTIKHFPEAEIKEYNSISECLDAVAYGKAQSTVLNGLRSEILKSQAGREDLSSLQLHDTDKRSIGVKSGNSELLLLLNRGINLVGEEYGVEASHNYITQLREYSVRDILHKYSFLIVVLLIILFAICIFFLLLHMRRVKDRQKESDRLNQELKKARNAAESSNNAKTKFLLSMSHDIRTPMNAIVGYADLLEECVTDNVKAVDYIHKIQASNNVLISLVNNVLELSQIESGKLVLEETLWDTVAFNDSLLAMHSEEIKKKNIEFVRYIDVRHDNVMCDTLKLRTIYSNLIGNAVKYTQNGGKITMKLMEIESDRPDYVVYRCILEDNGIGISKERLEKIKKSFERDKTALERHVDGSGLGLAIVKRLVDFMEGSIEIESTRGVGTKVIVTIPHRIATEKDIKEAKASIRNYQKQRFDGMRVLMAEDNDLNAEITTTVLGEMGFEVDRVSDGASCVETFSKAPDKYYNLIIMDVQMPALNGYDATLKIRSMSSARKSNIPIVAMTANAFAEDKEAALRAGMNDYITKPVKPEEIRQILSEALKPDTV